MAVNGDGSAPPPTTSEQSSVPSMTTPQSTNPDLSTAQVEPDDVQLVGQTIERVLQSLLELGICASDVQPTALEIAEPGLPASGHPAGLVGRKVLSTIEHLNALYALADRREVGERMVPLEVIQMVDQGKNPDKYTRDFVERTAGENMFTNGIVDAFKGYEGHLKGLLEEAFPDMKDVLESTSTG